MFDVMLVYFLFYLYIIPISSFLRPIKLPSVISVWFAPILLSTLSSIWLYLPLWYSMNLCINPSLSLCELASGEISRVVLNNQTLAFSNSAEKRLHNGCCATVMVDSCLTLSLTLNLSPEGFDFSLTFNITALPHKTGQGLVIGSQQSIVSWFILWLRPSKKEASVLWH